MRPNLFLLLLGLPLLQFLRVLLSMLFNLIGIWYADQEVKKEAAPHLGFAFNRLIQVKF